MNYPYNYGNGDRFIFGAPFLLGALTGGVAVAATNPYRPRPYYPIGPVPGPFYHRPYPYY